MNPSKGMKILFITGTRADFGKLEPLALAARDAGYNVTFFVTGMHMLNSYGLTKLEVHRVSGVKIVEFLNQREGDPQDAIFVKTVTGLSDYVQEDRPDLMVIHGDRVEAMAAAFVSATNYIRSAHIEGGEVSGTIDEIYRHCITKLSCCHLVTSQRASERVRAMGEAPSAIYVIGSPELDAHSQPSGVSLDEVKRKYEISFDSYGIVIFHAVTSEIDSIGKQAASLYSSLVESQRQFVVIKPNNDPGSQEILRAFETLPESRFRILPSMRFNYFSELLRHSSLVVGNSSVGVREAPFLGIPSVNIGSRQLNRATAPSIHNADANDQKRVISLLAELWGRRFPSYKEFGNGHAVDNFLAFLANNAVWQLPLQKSFCDGQHNEHQHES